MHTSTRPPDLLAVRKTPRMGHISSLMMDIAATKG